MRNWPKKWVTKTQLIITKIADKNCGAYSARFCGSVQYTHSSLRRFKN